MGRRARAAFAVAALCIAGLTACGASGSSTTGERASRPHRVALREIGSFDNPVYATGAPGFPKLLFVVEQAGRVEVLRGGRRLGHPFLDISGLVSSGGERGLLSIAFPPDYARSRRFYVYYTDRRGDIRVDELKRRSATRAVRGSRRAVIEIPHPVNANHNGGQLQFLGNLLYLGTGDGGSGGDPPNNAQNLHLLLGKLLRIDPLPSHGRPYSIPPGNPFAGGGGGRPEIYSYGLRNPFRFSFDRVSARRPRLAIGDVGQSRFEEVDYTTVGAAAGANFGWDAFEGYAPYRDENSGTPDPGGTTKPIFAYTHSRDGSCSIIGGYVVGDRRLPSLYGRYVYADLCEGRLRSLVPHRHRASGDRRLGLSVSSPSSFGEDDRGRIYVCSLDGPVYRLVPGEKRHPSAIFGRAANFEGSGQVESGTAPASTESAANGGARAEAERLEVLNPATGATIARVEIDSPQRVAEAVARVRGSQPAWEALGIEGRYRWLGKLRDWLLDNSERVLDTMQAETGKVRADASNEPAYLADLVNFYGARASKFIGEEAIRPHTPLLAAKKLRVQYRPYPVVGIISPWNFPLVLGLGDALPALQAGAAVVVKPSEFTPLGLAEVVKAWKEEIGGPDVFDCVQGIGECGGALVDSVDFVQFTGSDRTGRKVMARAAETLTPVSLELGGKDAMIVLDDADLDRAANAAAWGGMMNAGQICMAVERVYVEEPAYDAFVAKLVSEVGALRQGADDARNPKDVGAMTSPNQSAIVEDHVNDALASGARALTGGTRVDGPGDYFEPTVLVDVDHSMKVMREETFGPVLGVMKVRDAEEALRLANDSRYGLSGSVFGERGRAERLARRIECGAVNVNDVLVNYLATDVPMGGWKQSGIGYRHGAPGIKKFCRTESLVITRFGGKREPSWYPYTRSRRSLVSRIARAFNARDWRRRLGLRAH